MKIRQKTELPLAAACALLLAAASPLRAEPSRSVCSPWMGSAKTWSVYDEASGKIRPMTLRECGGIPKGALSYAQKCMELFGDQLASKSHVIIGDFSTQADFVRLYVLQWNQADPQSSIPLLRGGLVSGYGNGSPTATGVAKTAKDQWNSGATPGGCMRMFGTGEEATIPTVARNLRAYRLDGLEKRNACTRTRGIFFHESYQENDVNRVETRRAEEVDGRDRTADFGATEAGANLGTSLTPGCITASEDDFTFIKDSGIVPKPKEARWTTSTPPGNQEGILFVSWFWGDDDGLKGLDASGRMLFDPNFVPQTAQIVPRYTQDPATGKYNEKQPRACTNPSQGIATPAVPARDLYPEALKQLEQLKGQQ